MYSCKILTCLKRPVKQTRSNIHWTQLLNSIPARQLVYVHTAGSLFISSYQSSYHIMKPRCFTYPELPRMLLMKLRVMNRPTSLIPTFGAAKDSRTPVCVSTVLQKYIYVLLLSNTATDVNVVEATFDCMFY